MRPSGTVTFLFTDIEGSTRLWELEPEGMQTAIAEHDALMSRTFEEHGGFVFKTVGDAFCVAFSNPATAVAATVAAQHAILQHSWPTPRDDSNSLDLRVRMALLTGYAEERGGDYFGQPLNRVARLLGLAHGGQVIASQEVAEATPEHEWQNLGSHRLRDLMRPINVYQMCDAGLATEFPALKSLNSQPTNLPEQLTPFLGREVELEIVGGLLEQNRLVTLLGTGGVGKTRLSLQTAADAMDSFPDGVWFVELAPVSDGERIAMSLAGALKVRRGASGSELQAVVSALGEGCHLIILDNCEHVIQSAAEFAEAILKSTRRTKIVATSREPLRISGEQRFRVPSLGVPSVDGNADEIEFSGSVQLFLERAQSILPHDWLTPEALVHVGEICRRLDGIPLAVELAAARLRSLSPAQIVDRLDKRFQLLTGGSRTALERQQTLRAALEWSLDLLSEDERLLFRRLSVFRGGWTLEAVESVCAFDGLDSSEVLDLLDSLVEKSLVVFDEAGRYRFLETMRELATELARDAGELDQLVENHLNHFTERSASWRSRYLSQAAEVYRELHADMENLLTAVAKARATAATADKGLRILAAATRYWQMGGHPEFGLAKFDELLQAQPTDKEALAMAYSSIGILSFVSSDYSRATQSMVKSVELFREVGDTRSMINVLMNLATTQGSSGTPEEAEDHARQVLATAEQEGYNECIPPMRSLLSQLRYKTGRYEESFELSQQALEGWKSFNNLHGMGVATNNSAHALRRLGRFDEAATFYQRTLDIRLEINDRQGLLWTFEGIAKLALAVGHFEIAVTLASAVTSMRQRLNIHQLEIDKPEWAATLKAIDELSTPERDTWMERGKGLDEGAVVSLARSELQSVQRDAVAH